MANELTTKAWCDLVFDEKNKEYGAYKLRSGLAHRNLVALIITILIALAVVLLPLFISFLDQGQEVKDEEIQVTELATLEEAEIKDESLVKKVDLAPPPPPLRSSIKFVPPIIAKDNEVSDADEMKSQEELSSSKVSISIADVKGNDDVHGADIADVKQVVVQAPKKAEEEKIYDYVEEAPSFKGGSAAMYKWLSDNLRYPTISQEQGVQGKVIVRFVVDRSGRIANVRVVRSLDAYTDKEAVRVVSSMPAWTPGKMNGAAVKAYFVLPVTFRLD